MAKPKYTWSEEQDQAIREIYKRHYFRGAIERLSRHPLFSGYPKAQIQNRAIEIGVSRELRRWTDEEEAVVAKYAGEVPVIRIQRILNSRGYTRSYIAVKGKIRTAHLRQKPDTYSLEEVAIGMRCSPEKVKRWITSGMLKAERDHPNAGGYWRISPPDLVRFIRAHVFELEACMPDIPWLVSLIDEFRSTNYGRVVQR